MEKSKSFTDYSSSNKKEYNFDGSLHVESGRENGKKYVPPLHLLRKKGPVATSTKQSLAYFTVKNIESETSYLERDWALFTFKELMDNAYDFLNDYYSNSPKEDRKIDVHIAIEQRPTGTLCHIKVRNSNVDNIPIFENLDGIFDFSQWYSTKRNQHREMCGSLGDFLKRGLGMGYASYTSSPNYTEEDLFMDKQWNEPLILKFNGRQEYRVFVIVDRSASTAVCEIDGPHRMSTTPPASLIGENNYTEVQVTLPLKPGIFVLERLEEYYRKYKVAKSNITFSFDKEIR